MSALIIFMFLAALVLAAKKSASPAAERFIAFALSKEGQNLLRAHGGLALADIPR